MVEIIKGIFLESVHLFNEMSPYLLFGFFFAGLLHIFISIDTIANHLGKSSVGSIIKAVILGIPLPLCSCGVIPAAVSLKRKGASQGAVVSFLIATPITGVDSIFATYSLLGPFFAIYRVIASAITAFFAGLFTQLFVNSPSPPPATPCGDAWRTGQPSPHQPEADPPLAEGGEGVATIHTSTPKGRGDTNSYVCSCEEDHCCSEHENGAFGRKVVELFRYAFGQLLGDIWKWLLIGVLLAGIISYLIPADFIENYLGNTWLSMIVMLVIGIPMYVCSTGSIPIAASLMLKGMSPGAALVFLLAGPATNAITITVLSKELGRKATILYLATIAVMSVLLGWLLNLIWFQIGAHIPSILKPMTMLPEWIKISSSVILVALILFNIIRRNRS